jgi:hypothetical protein
MQTGAGLFAPCFSGQCLQVMAHYGWRRLSSSDGLESESPERRSRAREHVRRATRPCDVDRVCFNSQRIGPLGRFQGLSDESRHDALSAVTSSYIETRDAPNRHVIDRLQSLLSVEPAQVLSWGELTPAYDPLAVKSQQARWRTLRHDFAQCGLILLSRSLVIFGANPPIHAPATVAGTSLSEEVFKRRP